MDENKAKSEKEINTELYFKLVGEFAEYRKKLLTMSHEEILRHSYEYSVRRDIVNCMEAENISYKQAEQLMKTENALDVIYAKYVSLNGSYQQMKRTREAVECGANELGREEYRKEYLARKARDREER